VIGASACGAKAAARIRRLCPDHDVTLLDESRYISYAACGMPYYLGGRVRAMDDLRKTTYGRIRDAAYFQEVKGIQIRTGLRALHIDRTARLVEAEDVATGKSFSFAYDALVLAMGAAPKTPPIPGAELRGVYHLTRRKTPRRSRRSSAAADEVRPSLSAEVLSALKPPRRSRPENGA
jgi:NADPH-dependent 2,4-dienoyl-CoA reductase/sulfur reductase-like enzyme